jgi:putative ABC transport system permease protein
VAPATERSIAVTAVTMDVQLGLRRLVRDRSLTLIAGLTLALGIGLNLVLFSFLDAAILRPLPFEDPSRVVKVALRKPVTYDVYKQDLRLDTSLLSGLVASIPFQEFTFRTDEAVEKVSAEVVSDNYFSVLGIKPSRGRLFSENTRWDSASVAVVSQAFWQRALTGDPAVIGRRIRLDDSTFTIVGVAEKNFPGVKHLHVTDVWCRFEDPVLSRYRAYPVETLLGRLRPGASPLQVREEVSAIASGLGLVDSTRPAVDVTREGEFSAGDTLFAVIAICMALPFIVLLMACANISMLIMARSESHRQEVATRLALGASRWQLIRQMLIETLLLAACAGAMAFAITGMIGRALPSLIPANLPSMELDARIDWRMLWAVIVFTLVATLVTGLSPAIRATDLNLVSALKTGSDGQQRRRLRLMGRNVLITLHIAASVAFLVVTALLAQGAMDLSRKTLGFSPERTLVIKTEGDASGKDDTSLRQQYDALLADVGLVPGVRRTSLSREVPFGPYGWPMVRFERPGKNASDGQFAGVVSNAVDAGFFDVIGIPIVEGRPFSDADDEAAPGVVVISRKLAETMWPGRHPEGEQALIDGQLYAVIGVAGDIEGTLPARIGVAAPPCVYFHIRQSRVGKRMNIFARLNGENPAIGSLLHNRLFSRPGGIRPIGIVSLRQAVEDGLTAERSLALYLSAMGLLALLLGGTGTYNLISYNASRLIPEIGIRKALGATPGSVTWMMLRRACWMAVIGTALGLPLAFVTSAYLGNVLYGMKAPNLLAFGALPVMLAGVVVLAGYLPSRWASRVDPMEALRSE